MSYDEQPILFRCGGETLVGILSVPAERTTSTGIVVVVGGPQYRVGSHRQFVLLCRDLAKRGIPCMRFDYRGMGDSTGEQRDFTRVDGDIRAALDEFEKHCGIDRFVLWGLCDGASAACLYAPADPRVTGLVLLNPWVRTESGEAKTYLKHYYVQRLFTASFWRKLLSGRVSVAGSLANLLASVKLAAASTPGRGQPEKDLPARMADALEAANLPVLLILSGKDYVAREFDDVSRTDPSWSALVAGASVERLPAADHTFSSAAWRDHVAAVTAAWLLSPTAESTQRSSASG